MYIFLAILVVVGVWLIAIYNRFVKFGRLVDEAWSGIDVQLKRRHDLIPNLVGVVKGYSEHEQSVFEEVTKLRAESEGESRVSEIGKKENGLSHSIRTIFAIAEDYPDLKANESFLSLHESIIDIEDTLQFARRYYNGTVRDFNTFSESFPNNVIGNFLNIEEKEFFNIENALERQVPKVSV